MIFMNWLKKIFDSVKAGASPEVLEVYCDNILVGTHEKKDEWYVSTYDKDCPKKYRVRYIDKEVNRYRYLPPFFTTRIPSRPDLKSAFDRCGDDCLKNLGTLGAISSVSPYEFKLKSDDERKKAA